ncbi:MAG: hypothetical protein AAGC93_23165 [Cyanobacteria bacterium P01_F01_bin.53]
MSTTLSIRPRSAQHRIQLSYAHALPDEASDDDRSESPDPNCAEPLITSLSHRQVTEWLTAIAQSYLVPQSFTQALTQTSLQSIAVSFPDTNALSQRLDHPVSEDMIAHQYTAMCLGLWQLAQLQAQASLSADASIGGEATPVFSKVSFAQQQVTQRLNKLCLLWAIGKWQRPTHSFFVQSATDFATLQAKWKNPAIQAALRQATAHLLQSPEDHWITTHTDAWAYLLGNAMYQLLQWNHQLTPQYLRELLQVNEGHS